jgi:ligand-binding sensor domain-containing protein
MSLRPSPQGLVLLGLSLLPGFALAQQPGPAAAAVDGVKRWMLTPFTSTPFECLTNETGLPAQEVSAITQDQEGYLWFGTQDGVAQYDGYRVTAIRHDTANPERSLSNPIVTSLAADDKGRVFIGTDGGLDVYDGKTHKLEHYLPDPANASALTSKKITSLLADAKGRVWIGTDQGLHRWEAANKTFTRINVSQEGAGPDQSRDVLSLFADRRGHLWIGTFSGVSDYDPDGGTFKHYVNNPDNPKTISGGGVVAIAEDSEGSIWVGTPGEGVSRIDPASGKIERFLSDPNDPTTLSFDDVLAIRVDRDGRIWIGTNGGGVSRLDPKSKKFTRIAAQPDIPFGLPRPRVLSVFQDRGGVLWFGTFGGGACKLDPYRLNFPLYLTRPGAVPIAEDSKGILYLGSHDGLHRFDRASGTTKSYRHDPNDPTGIGGNTVWALRLDKSGMLWMGVIDYGLERFDPRSETFHHYPFDAENPRGLRSGIIFAIFEDSKARLWVGTWGAGLAYLDRSNDSFVYFDTGGAKDKSRISSDFVYVIYEDRRKPGILWIGTDSGLNKFDTDHKIFTQYATPPEGAGATSFDILSIYQDAAGMFWVGTHSHGLLKFNPETGSFERFKAAPSGPIYGILDDSKGKLWLTTTTGLFQVDPEAGTAFRFEANDGLQGLEFGQNSYYKSARTGELLVGGSGGLNVFKPEQVRFDDYIPPVAIRRFQILGKDVDLPSRTGSDGAVELSYFDRMVSIEFSALSYGAPSKQRYMYRLKGLHDDWIEAPTRTVSYSNLDGGDYLLEVKAANRHGVWNEKGLAMKIHVDPAPWKTWWAYLSYTVLAAGAVAVYVRS